MEIVAGWHWALALGAAGFASGVHCIGMCGGIVSAATFSARRLIPIRASPASVAREWPRQLALNAGRITSYACAGAIAGALGSAGAYAAGALAAQSVLFVLANVMLVLIGLYLAGVTRLLAPLEALGRPVWRALQPLAGRLLSGVGLGRACAAGFVWGWLPCGLVYGALGAAVFAGNPAQGALGMLAFGVGTLPGLMLAGLAAGRLQALAARRAVRVGAGALVLGFGVLGLARADGLAETLRGALLCL